MLHWKKQLSVLGLCASLVGTGFSTVNVQAKGKEVSLSNSYISKYLEEKRQEKVNKKPAISEDTLIVKYNRPISASEHNRAGATPIKTISKLNYTVVKIKKKGTIDTVLKAYQKMGKVELASPSAMYTTQSTNDPKVKEQYHLALLQIEKAQSLVGNKSIKVAVIDQGADRNHPDLAGQLLPGYNTVSPINQPAPDFHGTHVSGIIAGKKNNGIGGYGVNPNADILNIDVFDRGGGAYDFAIADAILYAADNGAKVINMSIGGGMPSPLIEDAVKKAIAKNVTIVASAGNSGDDGLNYPAAFEGVISVGSTNKDNKLSSYSTFGPSVDIVAPGENVYAPIYEAERKSSFDYLSGTSMASPVVAGVASLLLTKYPNLTPAQVEYVLEHTAKDLGAKGFDTKFGNGLVNPVDALKFDVKKIPASVKNPKTESEILKAAKSVTVAGKYSYSNKITKANEEQWIKFPVKEGEFIQTSLQGAAPYDYKYKLHLYSEDGTLIEEVNQVREGKPEGKLLEIPYSGTLAIGIKDANGSFDDSGKGLSHFKLNIERSNELAEDGVDVENPLVVDSFPYSSKGKALTFTGEEGDEDYFKISVDEKQMVRVKTSAVPGIDASLNVYLNEQFFPPTEGEDGEGEEGEEKTSGTMAAKPSHEDEEEFLEPMYYSNSRGYGEGETLVFEAEPGIEYLVATSNMMKYNDFMFDFFMNEQMMYQGAEGEFDSSNLSYEVTMDSKVLPEDEDNYPILEEDMPEEEYEEGEIDAEEYVAKKQAVRDVLHDAEDEADEYERMILEIQESALEYNIGEKAAGYLQMIEDEDYFKVTPSETAIYDFSFAKNGNIPALEMYELIEQTDEEGNTFTDLSQIGANYTWDWSGIKMDSTMLVGLRKNKTYYVKVMNDPFNENSISFDQYAFSSKLKIKNPEDKYENNDKLERVKNLPAKRFSGNFAMQNDMDVFYLKPGSKDTLFGVNIDRYPVTNDLKKKYPAELLGTIYSAAIVFEDKNNNRKVDDSEFDTLRYMEKGWETGHSSGSFLAKKGKGYVIAFVSMTESPNPSLIPYSAQVAPVNVKDEDAGSVVRKYKPSKPLSLKKVNSKKWTATGYLNAGVTNGDTDWYALKLTKDSKAKLTLDIKNDVDAVMSIYKDGKLVKRADYYRLGDDEVLLTNLKKGTYYIEVKDKNRNASLSPYTLNVEF
ncbi:S8 family peptidase [Fictibacillus phosphorivorans]|uniref:S8 family peptidase n=1 Tax=Fictibacillus phosphorivorans TaxID=1221500 RepID=UPI0011A7C4AA|nr:S8 family peptidase [Fictibacillus phosphorivorans]